MDSGNFADSDDAHILQQWEGVIIKCYEGEKFQKYNITPYN